MQYFPHSAAMNRRASALALSLAVALLGACGGGSDSSAPAPAPAPAPSASDFLLAGVVTKDSSTGRTLLVIDPAQPGSVRFSVDLPSMDYPVANQAYNLDIAGNTITFLGESMLYYVKDKQVFQVSLRKADATQAKRISSVDNACLILGPMQARWGGDAAWVAVSESGPDGDCAAFEDNTIGYIRAGASATTAPTRLPAGVSLIDQVPTDDMLGLQFFLALDSRGAVPKISLYSPELTEAGDVAGGQGVTDFRLQYRPAANDHVAYAFVDGTLRRLSWSASGATLSPSIHAFKTSRLQSISDQHTFFFVDGYEVQRVVGNGTPELLGTLDAARGLAQLYYKTPSSLVFIQSGGPVTDGTGTLSALPKSGGALRTLATVPNLWVSGTADENVFFESTTVNTMTIKRIGADGQNETLLTDKAYGSTRTLQPGTMSLTENSLTGLLWCEPAQGDTDCRNARLVEYNVATGSSIRLGQFAHTGTDTSWDPLAARFFRYSTYRDNTPVTLHASGFRPDFLGEVYETYVVQPGVADSLVRVNSAP